MSYFTKSTQRDQCLAHYSQSLRVLFALVGTLGELATLTGPPSSPVPRHPPCRNPYYSQAPDLALPPSSPHFFPPLPCSVPRGQNPGLIQLPRGSLGQRACAQTKGPFSPTSVPVLAHGPGGPAPAPVPSAWDSWRVSGNLNIPSCQLHPA